MDRAGSGEPQIASSRSFANCEIAVDPDIKPPSSSELSLGGEYEIIPQGRLGLTYIRRWTNNIIEDMSRDALGNVFFLGNLGLEKAESRQHQLEALGKAVEFTKDLLRYTSNTNYVDVLTSEQSLLTARSKTSTIACSGCKPW